MTSEAWNRRAAHRLLAITTIVVAFVFVGGLRLPEFGAVIIGPARQIAGENDMGMLKGLVQERVSLGAWKDLLVARPFEVKKVFLATRHVARLLPRTVLGSPSQPLESALSGASV